MNNKRSTKTTRAINEIAELRNAKEIYLRGIIPPGGIFYYPDPKTGTTVEVHNHEKEVMELTIKLIKP